MCQAGISHSAILPLPHHLDLQPERRGIVCVGGELYCNQENCNSFSERGAKQDVRRSIGMNKGGKSDKKERKNERSAAKSTNFAEAPN